MDSSAETNAARVRCDVMTVKMVADDDTFATYYLRGKRQASVLHGGTQGFLPSGFVASYSYKPRDADDVYSW